MRRFAFAILVLCVSALLGVSGSPAQAGGYYEGYYGGYGGHHYSHRSVTYSTRCCYRKIIRHERSVRYQRIERPYYREGYYERSYRPAYYSSPRRYEDYSYRPRYRDRYAVRRYVDDGIYGSRCYRRYGATICD